MTRLDNSRQRALWFGGTSLLLALGCATPEPADVPDNPGSGGTANTEGGSSSLGGSSSGAPSFGGATSSGGASMGGASSSGGANVGGGGTGSGGAATTSGGATAKGGASSGGAAAGGSTSSGGASSNGGTQGGAGASAKGGTTSTMGGATSGGSTSSGGVLQATGGSAGAATGGSGGAGTTCSGFVFCDDFEDGNSTGWTPTGGTWTVTSDGSQVYSGGLGSYLSTAGSVQANQTVQARMKVLTMSSGSSYRAGIVARYGSSSNYYTLALDGAGDFRLLKGSSSVSGATGTCDTIASGLGSVTNTWMTLKMVVSGSASSVHITTFKDTTPLHDCTTTSGTLANGVAGVMTYGSNTRAQFDDFQVSSP